MNSSDTSAKYSCPRREQKDAIQDSGTPDELDMVELDMEAPRKDSSVWRRSRRSMRLLVPLSGVI